MTAESEVMTGPTLRGRHQHQLGQEHRLNAQQWIVRLQDTRLPPSFTFSESNGYLPARPKATNNAENSWKHIFCQSQQFHAMSLLGKVCTVPRYSRISNLIFSFQHRSWTSPKVRRVRNFSPRLVNSLGTATSRSDIDCNMLSFHLF